MTNYLSTAVQPARKRYTPLLPGRGDTLQCATTPLTDLTGPTIVVSPANKETLTSGDASTSQRASAPSTRFTLVVQDTGQAARLAQRFVSAAATRGDSIEQIFFYHDGVLLADSQQAPAQDDPALPAVWADLAEQHNIPLNVCIAAGARRGVLSDDEAKRHGKAHGNLRAPFELVGLGVFVEGLMNADRVITFSN